MTDHQNAANAAEVSCLGSVLINPKAMDVLMQERVTESDFSDARHQAVFGGLEALTESGVGPDIVTLRDTLANRGDLDKAGGVAYVHTLVDGVPAASNVQHYARIVKEASRKRGLEGIGLELTKAANSGRPSGEVVSEIQSQLDALSADTLRNETVRLSDELHNLESGAAVEQIETGIRALDRLTGGLTCGELWTIGAWSGHGKSALCENIASHAAMGEDPKPVAIFSLEMPRAAVARRLWAVTSGLSIARLSRGEPSPDDMKRLESARAKLRAAAPVYIRDGAMSIDDILAEARRLISRHGVKVLVVDYIQLVGSRASDRRLQVEECAQKLLGLAVGEGVAVLAASQLRKRDAAHTGRPNMHDLRESAALFEAPHVVALIYRPQIGKWDKCKACNGGGAFCPRCGGEGGKSLDTKAVVLVEKNRNGPTSDIELAWRGHCLKFADLETRP